MTEESATAICREILARALDLMASEGVTDTTATREIMGLAITLALAKPNAVDANDVVRLALALIGGRCGGPQGIAAWAEQLAAAIRSDPSAAPPTVFN